MAAQLSAKNIPFTIVERTVSAGESTSGELPMENLKVYTYDAETGTIAVSSDEWEWVQDNHYTIQELPLEENQKYTFYSLDGSRQNSCTFTCNAALSPVIDCVNQHISWEIDLLKKDQDTGTMLSGALFGLYTTDPDQAHAELTEEEINDLGLTKLEMTKTIDGTAWYLMDWKTTDSNGTLTWTGLMEDAYYLEELRAPSGYELNTEPGQVVQAPEGGTGSQAVLIENHLAYELPMTGGTGTQQYAWIGTAILLVGVSGWYIQRKQKGRRIVP
jgi:LPXTG-motif cell wall-anchored protein